MPKISAPTVAEHRSAQRRALLEAAQTLLLADGLDAVGPAAVAKSAGLARSTFYEYFPSRDDLLVELARDAFAAWSHDMTRALAGTRPGEERLTSYLQTTLKLTADGRHSLATALRGVDLSPTRRQAIEALHVALDDPLGEILAELEIADSRGTAPLVRGLLGAAMSQVAAGADLEHVTAMTTHIILAGVRAAHELLPTPRR